MHINAALATDLVSHSERQDENYGNVIRTPFKQDVYDLSFAAYSQEFADKFGAVPSGITKLDKGLHFMEVRMVTEGKQTNCYYHLVLNKDIKLAIPNEEFVHQSFPIKYDSVNSDKWSLQQIKDKAALRTGRSIMVDQRFNNKTYLGNVDYQFNTKGEPFSNGITFGILLNSYFPDQAGFQVLSMWRECGGGTLFDYSKPAIWLMKAGKHEDTTLPQKENYHLFIIPDKIIKSLKPVLKKYGKRQYEIISEQSK